MPNVKQVILKDPKTGQYLSPKVYGALTYEPAPDGGVPNPPYEDGINASQLDGHPASYFAPADHNHDDKYAKLNHTHTQDQVNGLTDALNGKANSSHTHTVSQITDMPNLTNMIPSGIICMWSGESTAIPSGWHLCDGDAGTPDLRDRFIVGAGSTYEVGNTGGEATHTLTVNEIPSHNHTFTGTSHSHTGSLSNATAASAGSHTHTMSENLTAASAGSHSHTISGGSSGGYVNIQYGGDDRRTSEASLGISGSGTHLRVETGSKRDCTKLSVYGSSGSSSTISSGGAHTHNISGTITAANSGAHTHTVTGNVTVNSATAGGTVGNTGGGQAHENRPPYFALCFIMKL